MADQIYHKGLCEIAEEVLSRGKSIARLATHLKVSRETIYQWREKHPEFEAAYKRGLNACQAYWEDIGHDGVVGDLKGFAGTSWMFTMKNRFRADYAEEKADKTAADTLVDKLIDKLCD